ncbi:uncharacterized protein [Dysidea avara]|uniref:uncharacterized protein isoform X2 n=1 Tax=Dysidea avara TaxID=196820 RepID=UPI0033172D94
MFPRKAKQKEKLSDMDQLTEKPKETVAATGKADTQDSVGEGILTRNRTGSFTKAQDSDKQPSSSLVKRASVPARPEQVVGEPVKVRRRRRTKAQIAADNAAKQEAERREAGTSNVPALPKKPGRPRGRPKKIRTTPPIPVETRTPPVVKSPTPPLQSEDPLPSLNTSQESFASPNISLTDQETVSQESTKLTDEPVSDFNMNTEQYTTVASIETTTLLKEDELKLLKEDTPLLKEDTSPLPTKTASVSEIKPDIMDTEPPVEEDHEQVENKPTKDTSEMTVTKDQVVPPEASPLPTEDSMNISTEDKAMDSVAPEQPVETVEDPTEPMDTSPAKPAPVESPVDKAADLPSDVQVPEMVETAAEKLCTLATTSGESIAIISPTMTVAVAPETATQNSVNEPVTTTIQLTNSESMFVDSLLSSHVVTASSNNSSATFAVVPSSSISTMTTPPVVASTYSHLPALVPSSATTSPINTAPINQLPPIVPSLLPSLMSASLPVQISTALSSASSDLSMKTSVASSVSSIESIATKSAESSSVSVTAAVAKPLVPVTSAAATSVAATSAPVTMARSSTAVGTPASGSAPATAELTTRDVAKLDPLPINLNTTLSVTLPTLSSLLTTPSGQQKLVLPLEKLVLPSSLDSHTSSIPFISSPVNISKPGNSCSYVITSMTSREDPVSLVTSSLAHQARNIQTVSSQKSSSALQMPIFSSMPLLEPKKPDKPETTVVENKLREIAPKTLGIELHQLTSDISRSSGGKKPELYEVLSNLKNVTRSVSAEVKSSPNATFATAPGTISISKEKYGDHIGINQTMAVDKDQSQHKPRPIAIKPDGMEFLKQINPAAAAAAAAAATSRTYATVHPLFPLTASSKTGNLLPNAFDLFRSSTAQKQFSTQAANISASVLPHLPGSSIATYPTQKAPPPLISITDGVKPLNVLGSVRVAVIDAPVTGTTHQSLSSIPAHMKVNNRPPQQPQQRPLAPPQQQTANNAPIIATPLLSLASTISAPPTTFSSSVQQQQHVPHPLTVGVHATTNKVSSSDVSHSHAQSSSSVSSLPAKVKSEYEPAGTSHIPTTSTSEVRLECPMCRHAVKNYKALCGHMKMHGGWDKSKFSSLDDYVCSYQSRVAKAQETAALKRAHAAAANANDSAAQPPPSKRHEGEPPQVFTFDNNSKLSQESSDRRSFINHTSATLDDLCKAAESVRKIHTSHSPGGSSQKDYLKRRPENIVIPSPYYSSVGTPGEGSQRSPPYTPPPLLSPRPSIFTNTPLTPRPLYWPQRRSSEAPTVSESEESVTYSEPKINVGEEFQAELGDCDETRTGVEQDRDFSELVFMPLDNLSRDDEDTLDGYFELACSPAVKLGGRNKEYAHHILHKLGGSVKEAVKVLLSGRSLVHKDTFMANYNYSGSTKWSTKERQRFRRAWRDNQKDFRAIHKNVNSKDMRQVIEYYYTWKKYCMDEYKGRSRHYSMEEELSEDELETINGLTYLDAEPYSDRPGSSGGAASNCRTSAADHHQRAGYSEAVQYHPQIQSVLLTSSNSTKPSSDTSPRPDKPTFKCTYPGCTAAYSSIFALNGHIRIHGGRGEKKEQVKTEDHTDGGDGRNQGIRSAPSPKRGPVGQFPRATPGSAAKPHKGKRISTTPHDQEGHYPCRLCGRVFDKVKSRSAHMKSHVVKSGGK